MAFLLLLALITAVILFELPRTDADVRPPFGGRDPDGDGRWRPR